MNKKNLAVVSFCIVFAILFASILPAYYYNRFKSYDKFLTLVSNLEHFKIQGFYEEPLGSRFANEFVSGSLNPKQLYLLRNNTIQSFIEKSDYSIFTTGLLPTSYFGFIHAREYFSEKYHIPIQKINNTTGFSKTFFVRFYNPEDHILTLVILRYVPEVNKKALLFSSGSLLELGTGGIKSKHSGFAFKGDISKYFKDSERDINENIDMYSGKHFIVSIVSFIPKNSEKDEKDKYPVLRFEKELLKMLYN